jgi:hypothetical protein
MENVVWPAGPGLLDEVGDGRRATGVYLARPWTPRNQVWEFDHRELPLRRCRGRWSTGSGRPAADVTTAPRVLVILDAG